MADIVLHIPDTIALSAELSPPPDAHQLPQGLTSLRISIGDGPESDRISLMFPTTRDQLEQLDVFLGFIRRDINVLLEQVHGECGDPNCRCATRGKR